MLTLCFLSSVCCVIQIDINILADIVATTGATIDSFITFFAKKEHHEKTIVDIGVLRYPDIEKWAYFAFL